MTKLSLAFILLSLTAACQKQKTDETNYNVWGGSVYQQRTSDEKVIPTDYLIFCRSKLAYNVHYYYSLVGSNNLAQKTQNSDGTSTITVPNAEILIEQFIRNPDSAYNKVIFNESIDLTITTNQQQESTFKITANQTTLKSIEEHHKNNPYFNHIKLGDEVLTLIYNSDGITNITKLDLPGLINGNRLECK